MPEEPQKHKTVNVFFSYSHTDERLRDKLEKHLSNLSNDIITIWHDRKIDAGDNWKDKIDEQLETADIILLLISSDFLASNYCSHIEMIRALERHELKECRVIPIILRPCEWEGARFSHLEVLPKSRKAVTSWDNRDEAFAEIARDIRRAILGPVEPATVDPKPARVVKRRSIIERLKGGVIRKKQWPLLLNLLIPLYFAFSYEATDPIFLLLSGVTAAISAILYWAVQPKKSRLRQSVPLLIVGSTLVVWGITKPICTLAHNPKDHKLEITVARFRPAERALRDVANNYYQAFLAQLNEQDLFRTKKYEAEVTEEQKERIEALVSSKDCDCSVFVWAEIKKKGAVAQATFHLKNRGALVSSYKDQNISTIDVKDINLDVEDEQDMADLITLLVGFAYYNWGDWQRAIDVLKHVDQDKYYGERIFYKAMCFLMRGVREGNNNDDLANAIEDFETVSSRKNLSDELKVAATLNLACARIAYMQYQDTKAAIDDLDRLVIPSLKELSHNWQPDTLNDKEDCNVANMNLVVALYKKYLLEGNNPDKLLQNRTNLISVAESALQRSHRDDCAEQRATMQISLGDILMTIGERSETQAEVESNLKKAKGYFEKAHEYFEEAGTVQDKAMTGNSLAGALTTLGTLPGDEAKDNLERANEIYRKILGYLTDEYQEDRGMILFNQAAALIELGKLGGSEAITNFEKAKAACEEAIRVLDKSNTLYLARAKMHLSNALYLLGSGSGDPGVLETALRQCEEANRIFTKDTEDWYITHIIRYKVCQQLAISNSDMSQYCQREDDISLNEAKLLCNSDEFLLKRKCPQ